MDSIALRPRKATEIVDAAIEVYRRNPIHFMLLTALVQVPWLIVQILYSAGRTDVEVATGSVLISLGTVISQMMIAGLIVRMASELYLGHETDAFETIRQTWRQVPAVFIASIITGIMIGISLLFFLFPAVWTSAIVFAVIPVIVLERRGFAEAFGRSYRLSDGVKMHVLAALGLVLIIRVVIGGGVTLMVLVIPMPMSVRYLLSAVSSIVIYPIVGIVDALIYYDVRIRKEGFDLEMMAGPAAPPAAAVV